MSFSPLEIILELTAGKIPGKLTPMENKGNIKFTLFISY